MVVFGVGIFAVGGGHVVQKPVGGGEGIEEVHPLLLGSLVLHEVEGIVTIRKGGGDGAAEVGTAVAYVGVPELVAIGLYRYFSAMVNAVGLAIIGLEELVHFTARPFPGAKVEWPLWDVHHLQRKHSYLQILAPDDAVLRQVPAKVHTRIHGITGHVATGVDHDAQVVLQFGNRPGRRSVNGG